MKVIKKEKKIQRKIANDIKKIRNKSDSNHVNNIVRDLRIYYKDNIYNEDTLFYRIDKLEKYSLFKETYFGFALGSILTYTIGDFDFSKLMKIDWMMAFSFILILTVFIIIIFLKDSSSIENGREEYLDKKEIEIITDIIENNHKRNYTRFRRTY